MDPAAGMVARESPVTKRAAVAVGRLVDTAIRAVLVEAANKKAYGFAPARKVGNQTGGQLHDGVSHRRGRADECDERLFHGKRGLQVKRQNGRTGTQEHGEDVKGHAQAKNNPGAGSRLFAGGCGGTLRYVLLVMQNYVLFYI